MLRSLFGELGLRRLAKAPDEVESGFPATTFFDGDAARQMAKPELSVDDVVVDSSPALAMRKHFAKTRSDLADAPAMITLLDPSRLWAPQVIRALSEAGGLPVQRLNLRERSTLRTLALIERAVVPRRQDGPLKVYHAEIRVSGREHDEIATTLAEGSHMTAVVIGAMQPQAVLALLMSLQLATREPDWHCPWLVFLMPPGSPFLRQRLLRADWPMTVRVAAMSESLTGPSTVWNTVLTAWEVAQKEPTHLQARVSAGVAGATDQRRSLPSLPAGLASARVLGPLMHIDGMLACGIVDLVRGDLLTSDCRDRLPHDLEVAAQALCAARRAHIAVAARGAAPPDELLVSAGSQLQLLRSAAGDPPRAVVALLDRASANMALVRFRLMELEPHL